MILKLSVNKSGSFHHESELPAESKDFAAAVEHAIAYAKANRGLQIQLQLVDNSQPMIDYAYTLFQVEYPYLEEFMLRAVRKANIGY